MKVLVVGAHPDDIAISCSGTVAKYVAKGDEVYLCTVSNGCYGHTEICPKELSKISLQRVSPMKERYMIRLTDDSE